MDTKDIILELRTKLGLSQDELAEKVFVTRQAVSRWESGDTTPNAETPKPENSRAYNRKRTQDWKKELPNLRPQLMYY